MRRGDALMALAGAAFLTVALLPTTGWLVRAHLSGSDALRRTLTVAGVQRDYLPLPRLWDLPSPPLREGTPEAFATAHADDPYVRLAWAIRQGGDEAQGRVTQIRALPPTRSTRAAALRLASAIVRVEERDTWKLTSLTAPNQSPPRPNDPKFVAAFVDDAQRGSVADGRNGFFLTMDAVGFLALDQKEYALSALHAAARLPGWEDYSFDEARGQIALDEGVEGRMPVVGPVFRTGSVLFPHYAKVRSLARFATMEAVRAELTGEIEHGMRLRRDVLRLGTTMRAHSRSLIGRCVGASIVEIGTLRPGGAAPVKEPAETATQWAAWAKAHGAADLAGAATDNAAIHRELEGLVENPVDHSVFGMGTLAATGIQVGALTVLGSALVLILLAGLLIALRRPLSTGARIGLCAAWLTVSTLTMAEFLKAPTALWALVEFLRGTMVCLCDESPIQPTPALAAAMWTAGLCALAAVATVPGLLIWAGIAHRRRPEAAGYAGRLAGAALPTAAVLILLYSLSIPLQAGFDTRLRGELDQLMVDETACYRSLID